MTCVMFGLCASAASAGAAGTSDTRSVRTARRGVRRLMGPATIPTPVSCGRGRLKPHPSAAESTGHAASAHGAHLARDYPPPHDWVGDALAERLPQPRLGPAQRL